MLLLLIVWIWTYNMPAVPIVASLAISTAAEAGTAALIGGIAASTFGVVGGAIVSGAVGGAIGGAVTGAVTGSDPGLGALTGAISGGVGGGVGTQLGGVSPTETAAIKGAAGFGTGTLSGLAAGEKFGTALKGGAVSGISQGIASGVGAALSPDTSRTPMTPEEQQMEPLGLSHGPNPPTTFPSVNPVPGFFDQKVNSGAQSALSTGIQSGLTDIFGSNTPSNFSPSSSPSSSPSVSPTQSQSQSNITPPSAPIASGTNPSVDALAQALRTVADLGYSPGGPVFGSQSNAPQRKVWNKASLRVTDENQ